MWGRGVRLLRLGKIDLRLDMSWFFIAALLTWSLAAGYFPSLVSESDPAQLLLAALIAMLGLFGSLILHELAHAVVAQREGVPVCTITLFLFGGVAEMRNEPPNAAAELRIALVGPLASLVLSVLAFGLAAAARGMGAPDLGVAVLRYLALANLVLAVFNMLPAFPLDGGRVFRAMLWRRSRDLSAATRRAAQVSAAIAYGMMALGVVQILTGGGALGLWPVLLGLFILVAGRSAQSRIEMRDALAGRSVAEVMRREVVAVDPGMTLQSLVDEVILTRALSFVPVVEAGRLLGAVDLETVRGIERQHWADTRVEDVFAPLRADQVVEPDADAADLLDRMARGGRRKFTVTEDGRLLGVVTLADLMARLRVVSDLSEVRP